MWAEQTTAIVLKNVEFSETSLIVTLFTRDFGRISAIAKGARRPKGPFEGSLDLLSVCRVVVIRKRADTLNLLTEAKLHRRFRAAERSLPRLYAGYYVAEILRLLTDDDDPHSDVYHLTISMLNQIDGVGDVASSIIFFEAQLLRLLGLAPGTDRCTDCGGSVDGSSARAVFSLSSGGIVCSRCAQRQHARISLRQPTIEWLRHLLQPASTLETPIPSELYGELRSLFSRYIETILGKVPRTQSLLPASITTEPTA